MTTGTTNSTMGGNPNEGHSILSEKVARALTVRTDTVAMKAALEALAHLDPATSSLSASALPGSGSSHTTNTTTGSTNMVVDSRSVRTAMEHDAFQQALALQNALTQIVASVSAVREGCSQVARTASKVRQAIALPVITAETTHIMLPTTTTMSLDTTTSALSNTGNNNNNNNDLIEPYDDSNEAAATLAEQKLAERLSDAFAHRDQARQRLEAVHTFLETFDLSDEDSALLDHYTFDDVASPDTAAAYHALSPQQQSHPHEGLAFLHALSRVRQIRQALSRSFASSSSNHYSDREGGNTATGAAGLGTSSALRMLENLSQKQERAYERLYHWLQQQLQLSSALDAAAATDGGAWDESSSTSSSLPLNDFVVQALHTLRHVPAFYNHLTELIAAHRRASVTRSFLLALTTGTAGGAPPMEMKAHDSVAYVGDMLAFAYRTFSVEADLAKGLLLFQSEQMELSDQSTNDETIDASVRDDDYDDVSADKPISAENMLSIGMSGFTRPLKSRILHVVSTLSRRPDDGDDEEVESDDGVDDDLDEQGTAVRTRVTHLYEICGLLLFYASAMEKGVLKIQAVERNRPNDVKQASDDDQNPLVECLLECLTEASKGYEASIRVYSAMLDQLAVVTGDSEASFVYKMIVLLADVRMNSPGFSSDVECPLDCQQSLSMDWLTETLVETCLGKCHTLDDAIALKQSLAASKKAGMNLAPAEKLDVEIEQKELNLTQAMVKAEAVMVFDVCGLGSLVEAWHRWKAIPTSQGIVMGSFSGLSESEVEAGTRDFFSSLYSPPLPSLEGSIKDPAARMVVRSKIAESVCEAYAGLYQSITAPNSGYADTSFLIHKPDEVSTLFSV